MNKLSGKIKHIFISFLHIIAAFIIFYILVTIAGQYILHHHGYDTPEKTVTQYINAWKSKRIWSAAMCFNINDKNYDNLMSDTYSSFENAPDGIKYHDIQIKDITDENTENIKELKTKTGVSDITDAKLIQVIIPYEQVVNNNYNKIENKYYFKTFEQNKKWFIQGFALMSVHDFGKTNASDQDIIIGNKTLGWMPVPGNWADAPDINIENSSTSTTYTAPYEEAYISLAIIDESRTIDDIVKMIKTNTASSKIIINNNAELNGRKCVEITINDQGCTKFWIFKLPMIDQYTRIIKLTCPEQDADKYCTDYIQKYKISILNPNAGSV